jgi:cytochrome c peroxidase
MAIPFAFVAFVCTSNLEAAATQKICSRLTDPASMTAHLGCELFFSKELSADNSMSCATCHAPELGFADGRQVSTGVGGKAGTRNTPSLLSAKVPGPLFWDGRRASLEDLIFDPITNPLEMGLESEDAAIAKLRANAELRKAFADVFREEHGVTPQQIVIALAAFVRSIPETASAYDRYVAAPAASPLSDEAARGLLLFKGKGGCAGCHLVSGEHAAFTDNAFHHSGIGWQKISARLPTLTKEVAERGLTGRELGKRLTADADWAGLGKFAVTLVPSDVAAFRTPSLRNVAITAPYMHDGSVRTLADAVDVEVYYRGLASATPIALSVTERRDLVVFLETLTDSSFLRPKLLRDARETDN